MPSSGYVYASDGIACVCLCVSDWIDYVSMRVFSVKIYVPKELTFHNCQKKNES